MTAPPRVTRQQHVRRLARMARAALAEFPVETRRIQFVGLNTNAVFRVFTETDPFALRLALPGWRTADDLRLAAAWQSALADETHLVVPKPLVARSGTPVVTVPGGATEPDRLATLEAWMPGGLLGRRLTVANAIQFGRLFAAMHAHGRGWQPQAHQSPGRVFDKTLSRGEPDVWAETARTVGSPARDVDVIERAADVTRLAYAALDPSDRQIIHCDLHHDNVKVWRGRLCPFDFEDTVVGHRSHDIAMAMLDLFDDVGPAAYPPMLDAFRAGYTAAEPWPDADILPFQVGRRIWVLNWIARHRPDHLPRAVPSFARTIGETLSQGRLCAFRDEGPAGGA